MESAQRKHEQTESEPIVREPQKGRAPVNAGSSWPLTLNDAHSPVLRLGLGFESSGTSAPPPIQAKLTVNEPGDQYEQEANRVAEQVMRMPDTRPRLQRKCGCGGATSSIESCAECAGKPMQLRRSGATPSASALTVPPIVHEVLRSPGQPLDKSTREFMESRFGHDFSQVRVHADERAAKSAREVNANAYTVGGNVVFGSSQYAPQTFAGRTLLAHELTHVIQPQSVGPAIRRQAAPVEQRTFIIIYGSGQLSPTTGSHHQGSLEGGGNFYLAAKTKRDKLVADLGADASKHNILFGYTPTEAEVKTFLNRKPDPPVAEIHIFSHGWPGGTNLGGPNPAGKRPAAESAVEQEQRWLQKEDLSEFDINFAKNASITFYGCNIGNVAGAVSNVPFAQEVSNAFGIPVTASTTSSHFERSGGTLQVPDKPGKMVTFTPQRAVIDAESKKYIELIKQFTEAKISRHEPKLAAGNMWNKVTGAAATYQAMVKVFDDKIAQLRPLILAQKAVVERFIEFLPEPDKTRHKELLPKIDVLIAYFDQLYPD